MMYLPLKTISNLVMTILKQNQINWFRQKTNRYRRKTASQTETKCNLVQRPKRSPWLLQKARIFYKGVNSNGKIISPYERQLSQTKTFAIYKV